MKKIKWKKYVFESLSIFVAVIAAFALNNWNDRVKDNKAESKILTEILNGLGEDIADVASNSTGHKKGIEACEFWRKVFRNKPTNTDTLIQHYFLLTRDFTTIQNTSGYETLKSRGFELIKNDSLRTKIISLYEVDYQALRKLEEEYYELQFHKNYFKEMNSHIAPHFQFNTLGQIEEIELPLKLKESERKILLSYLWKIQLNRSVILKYYDRVKKNIKILKDEIKIELNQ